jgi:transcriptional regulator with XRE-family HTH domain
VFIYSVKSFFASKKYMGVEAIDQFVIDLVREKRIAIKMSQANLAIEMDVSEGFIGNVESTKTTDKYSVAQINKLARIFKCSPRDFLPEEVL